MAQVRLIPHGASLVVADGAPLADALAEAGVEMPCGGRGTCGRCRVRIASGTAPVLALDHAILGAAVDQGWRLGCRLRATGDLDLAVGDWTTPVLADHDGVTAVRTDALPGIAVDLGTTTIAAQAVDADGCVTAVATGVNPQARRGADVVSRLEHALAGGADGLRDAVRDAIAGLCRTGAASLAQPPRRVVIAGNTVMHHLFCGLDVAPLARKPFASPQDGMVTLPGTVIGLPESTVVTVLPAVGGMVGGDITAGILASGLLHADQPELLVDLGTNGEIALGWRGRVWAAATAAGPAFEGCGIRCGMRAATGAIVHADWADGALRCTVLGGGPARGLCGSGLVDVVAVALDQGLVRPHGRLAAPMPLVDGLELVQGDIRALQLAKGAVAAGVERVCAAAGIAIAEVAVIHLAGAFGNYLDPRSAVRIGLLPGPVERLRCAGNTSLHGARRMLATGDDGVWLRDRCTVVPLDADPGFTDAFAEAMLFPA